MQHRTPAFCLVDECDSILIDEARTPLIISKQVRLAPRCTTPSAFAGSARLGALDGDLMYKSAFPSLFHRSTLRKRSMRSLLSLQLC